jgi:atypical dual specificity phosphatase
MNAMKDSEARAIQKPLISSLSSSGFNFQNSCILFFGAMAIVYAMFQKKLLPHEVSKVVSQIFFYPTFPITALLRIGNYWTKVDETVYLGCAPMALLNHPKMLYDMGVRGVVNCCYEYPGPYEAYEKLGIKQLHFPVVDHTEVPFENLKEAVQFIQTFQDRNEKVLVHCKAGHGRGASVALAWMMSKTEELTTEVC